MAALYSSRGLPPTVVDSIRSYCVFGTVARTARAARFPIGWRHYVTPDGKPHRLKTKPEWVAEWKKLGVDFGWSILPAAMTSDTGNWAPGFTTMRLPTPGVIMANAIPATMDNLACAPVQPPAAP